MVEFLLFLMGAAGLLLGWYATMEVAASRPHYVIFRSDRTPDGHDGRLYVKNKEFPNYAAAKAYARTISASRDPIIVMKWPKDDRS